MTVEIFQWLVLGALLAIAFAVGRIADDVRKIRRVVEWQSAQQADKPLE